MLPASLVLFVPLHTRTVYLHCTHWKTRFGGLSPRPQCCQYTPRSFSICWKKTCKTFKPLKKWTLLTFGSCFSRIRQHQAAQNDCWHSEYWDTEVRHHIPKQSKSSSVWGKWSAHPALQTQTYSCKPRDEEKCLNTMHTLTADRPN